MAPTRHLTRRAHTYLVAMIAIGSLVVIHSAVSLVVRPVSNQWMLLAALTFLTGSFSVKVPSITARISVSEAFSFAAVLLYGPAAATTIVALDTFVMSMWFRRDQRLGLRSIFNLCAVALAMWIAATVFFTLASVEPGQIDELLPLERRLWQLFVLAGLYFLLNSWFVAAALAFERETNVLELWWRNFPWFSLNYFGGVSVAALLVSYSRSVDLGAVGIILPLLLISYLTYRTSLGRIEDAMRHVDQVNALYMSTIETLAMAVDAKDQITHGHIRRVQVYTVELAKRLGVNDEQQLRAIGAAALLHDMGKLAIPEHILNKPGKLTDAEFDKMKCHADIGADLLSSINFPYPVVPIVRHHHERWSGGGYPAGIAGSDIPIGARILSVVDCFDALTSDRPYRPRLTTAEAFGVIRERRGTMYDPIVVDTFVSAYAEIAPGAVKAGQDARRIMNVAASATVENASVGRSIPGNTSEAALLKKFEQQINSVATSADALDLASQVLRQLTPGTVYAYYQYSPREDCLTCSMTTGDPHRLLDGVAIRLGERVTGWTAANRRGSVNSHAELDLGELASQFSPSLQSTISSPLARGEDFLGVLTSYSAAESAFSESHQDAFEHVAESLAIRLATLSSSGSGVVSFPRSRLEN